MTEYSFPTVIQQPIPLTDMTPLERLVLSHIFDAEPHDDALYFHAADGPSDILHLPLDQLQAALEASATQSSATTTYVAERIARLSIPDAELDFSGLPWECILHDIVRRSTTLRFISAVMSFTCSKMRPDGFGGMAVFVTAAAIRGKSTSDMLEEWLAEDDDAG